MRYLPAPISIPSRTLRLNRTNLILPTKYKMAPTDRQTDKGTRWQFTAYEHQYDMIDNCDTSIIKMIKYQDEICPNTQRPHRQGCLLTHKEIRFNALTKILPGVHIERAINWPGLLKYCEKNDTRDLSGSQVIREYNEYAPKKLHDLLTEFAGIYLRIMDPECPICNQDDCKCTVNTETSDVTYWTIANQYLRTHPELCGLVGQPLPQNLWKNTREVWIDRYRAISITRSVVLESGNEIISSPIISNGLSSQASRSPQEGPGSSGS